MFGSYQLVEGLERTFALNHMAYFVLAEVLRPRLAAAAPARIVSTASDAHKSGSLDLDDLQSEHLYARPSLATFWRSGGTAFAVYGRSKLCNILFTRELARRLVGAGVTANCLHPGFVATRFGDQTGGLISLGVRIAKRFALTPEEGAETIVHLASSPEVAGVSGEYFHRSRPATPSAEARDDALASRLWAATARLAGMEDRAASQP
jgi:NAD(P)-dependent dehydrogenase (short-subunit alcohol dehydrogenase family)